MAGLGGAVKGHRWVTRWANPHCQAPLPVRIEPRTRTNARRAPGDMGPREAPMLRNIRDLYGYAIHATDGDIGSVHDFYFDDQHWTVRHLVVTTGRSLSCHRVLVDPMSVTNVDGTSEELHIALTKAQVANSPDVDTDKPVSRQRHAE